jgi:hypothetical protein
MTRTISNPASGSSLSSSVIRDELQARENEIADLTNGHSHNGVNSKLLDWDEVWSDPIHNHSSNDEGGQISASGLATDSVETAKIKDSAVNESKLADGAVNESKLADGAVSEDKLEDGVFVPVGGIIIWSGAVADIPDNWQICDGTNGTPNLTDRFVIHADSDSGGTNNVGDTGGANTVNLSHSHGRGSLQTLMEYNIAGGGSWMKREAANSNWVASFKVAQTIVSNSGTRKNATVIQGTTGSAGSSSTQNRPKYYALAYIQKLT